MSINFIEQIKKIEFKKAVYNKIELEKTRKNII